MRWKKFGTMLLALLTVLSFFSVTASARSAAPWNYQETVETGGPIEKQYLADGPYEVKQLDESVLQVFQKYTVYYPKQLESDTRKYPVIVLCNGSGTPLSQYSRVARHYASWGFIVIGTEENYAWNGFGAEMSLRYLELSNQSEQLHDKKNIFYQRIDFDNVGIVGHSQGGVGVFNAITDQKHHDIYKTAVSLSPTNKALAHNLMWDYDASKVKIPILLISGAGGGDDWVVTGDQLREIYNDIPSKKVMVRRKNTPHGEVLYSEDGYVTAWFLWQLQGNQEAAKAFTGKSPELASNPLYQDYQSTL